MEIFIDGERLEECSNLRVLESESLYGEGACHVRLGGDGFLCGGRKVHGLYCHRYLVFLVP